MMMMDGVGDGVVVDVVAVVVELMFWYTLQTVVRKVDVVQSCAVDGR